MERIQELFAEALVEASEIFQRATENAVETDAEAGTALTNQTMAAQPTDTDGTTTRFSHRDTSGVPDNISNFVDTSLSNKRSNAEIEVSLATQWVNKAINRLGPHWKGKYTGALRTFTSRYVRHVMKQHGDPVTEALRGQLHMDADAIKIALSNLKAGKGRVVEGTYAKRGTPTIITEIPINGYTIYAEEPVQTLNGIELSGRTMYMTPTSTKALMPTRSANIPQRRSEGHKVIIDGKKRIVNGILTDASGNIAEVNYIDLNGSAYAGGTTRFLFTMCNDTDLLLEYAPNGATVEKARVAISNPYIVTTQNPVFSTEDLEQGLIGDRIKEIRDLGFDAIIMDYKPGDNYMVLVFDQKSVAKQSDKHSDRDDGSVSNRALLAGAFEDLARNDMERNRLREYREGDSS